MKRKQDDRKRLPAKKPSERKGMWLYPRHPVPVVVDIVAIAAREGVNPKVIQDAHDNLVRSRLLTETPQGVLINQDYSQWIFPETGEPRLSPEDLEHCLSLKTPTRIE